VLQQGSQGWHEAKHDLERPCPGVSRDMIRRQLWQMQKATKGTKKLVGSLCELIERRRTG
jgi:hypothetical protein